MREWDIDKVARAAGASVVHRPGDGAERGGASGDEQAIAPPGPVGVSIDSRKVEKGDLFIGLKGERTDGGRYVAQALEAGAWGVLVAPENAQTPAKAVRDAEEQPSAKATSTTSSSSTATTTIAPTGDGVVLAHEDPLKGLQMLARAWLGELKGEGMKVVGVTGSTGKTSTKDILAAMLSPHLRTVASPENQNTEIGLPLAILGVPAKTEALVLEMAMRGKGQIAELARIGEPDVGVIVNVGPVHLEQMGSIEGVAEAKGELIAGMAPGATVVVPADEPLLEPYRRKDVKTVTFGPGGDVQLKERKQDGEVVVGDGGEEIALRPTFEQEHNLKNLVAAVAAARAIGVTPEGEVRVRFSRMRGERRELVGGGVLIEDCYNANPMSMRAAIDDLVQSAQGAHTSTQGHTHTRARTGTGTGTRKVAVLGDMLELGQEEERYHREIGEYAAARGVEVLVTVGRRAAEMARAFAGPDREIHAALDAEVAAELLKEVLEPGDTVLVKGSRGMELERVAEALRARDPAPPTQAQVQVQAQALAQAQAGRR
jgi:UDP-N-acetylmuramoyl-tripeptide--D-alanyl-D-alanine ligase